MKILVIGIGYVGLVTAVGLAELGHRVFGVDVDQEKLKILSDGRSPFYEPELDKYLRRNLKNQRLTFHNGLAVIINQSDFIFICVGTPPQADGSADLTYIKQVAFEINRYAKSGKIVVTKSTVPVGTGQVLEKILNGKNGR